MQIQRVDWYGTLAKRVQQQRDLSSMQETDLMWQTQPPAMTRLHCLLLDCSGSMLARRNLSLAKGLLQHWVQQLYQHREHLMVIGFGGDKVTLLQPARKAVAFNEHWIQAIRGGGGTPVVDAVAKADILLRNARRKQSELQTALWMLTDGRFQAMPEPPQQAQQCTIVDFEQNSVALGRARQIAQFWGAHYSRAGDWLTGP